MFVANLSCLFGLCVYPRSFPPTARLRFSILYIVPEWVYRSLYARVQPLCRLGEAHVQPLLQLLKRVCIPIAVCGVWWARDKTPRPKSRRRRKLRPRDYTWHNLGTRLVWNLHRFAYVQAAAELTPTRLNTTGGGLALELQTNFSGVNCSLAGKGNRRA